MALTFTSLEGLALIERALAAGAVDRHRLAPIRVAIGGRHLFPLDPMGIPANKSRCGNYPKAAPETATAVGLDDLAAAVTAGTLNPCRRCIATLGRPLSRSWQSTEHTRAAAWAEIAARIGATLDPDIEVPALRDAASELHRVRSLWPSSRMSIRACLGDDDRLAETVVDDAVAAALARAGTAARGGPTRDRMARRAVSARFWSRNDTLVATIVGREPRAAELLDKAGQAWAESRRRHADDPVAFVADQLTVSPQLLERYPALTAPLDHPVRWLAAEQAEVARRIADATVAAADATYDALVADDTAAGYVVAVFADGEATSLSGDDDRDAVDLARATEVWATSGRHLVVMAVDGLQRAFALEGLAQATVRFVAVDDPGTPEVAEALAALGGLRALDSEKWATAVATAA